MTKKTHLRGLYRSSIVQSLFSWGIWRFGWGLVQTVTILPATYQI